MPDLKFIVEDASPLLTYSTQWDAGTPNDDKLSLYSESSFMKTQVKDETMTFSFYGTEVGVYGALRFNHGQYTMEVDGVPTAGGLATGKRDPDLFKQQLAVSRGLQVGQHKVVLKNLENAAFLDVDYVTWVTRVGNGTKAMDIITLQADQFEFSRAEDWTEPKVLTPDPSLSSGRATSVQGAIANFTFHSEVRASPFLHYFVSNDMNSFQAGSVIALYGPVGPRASRYALLFFAGGLEEGPQTLELTHAGNLNEEFAIDYANIYLPRREGEFSLQKYGPPFAPRSSLD
ncbi:hypothetical protein MD484_g417, partial [Candolleomyces efflorescens]